DRTELPCDLLRSNILGWRSRCYRCQRDWEAAREDVERALELADGLNDRQAAADIFFQASLVAEREGHWVLARSYAEQAKTLLEQDRLNEADEMFQAADNSFEQLSSASHRAAAWVAIGDLAVKRGDDREAARQFRRAAETLQDFRF